MEASDPPGESPETDETLLARVVSSDQIAFEALFRRYQKRLFRYLAGRVRDDAVAEELVCETLADVWRNAQTFQGRSRVSTWIFGIASHKVKTALRRSQPVKADPGLILRLEDPTPGPADEVACQELAGQVRTALEDLSPEHR